MLNQQIHHNSNNKSIKKQNPFKDFESNLI